MKYLFKNVLANDKITGPKMNAMSPLTTKPGTKIEASQKHTPFTTNENNPSR
jgi:hypothetical protein